MAGGAYRAVFLRIHPTGKGVLSLTTQADGQEATYAQALGTAPSNLRWENGAWTNGRGPGAGKTLEDVALYAHGSGDLPPGVDGGLDAQTVY